MSSIPSQPVVLGRSREGRDIEAFVYGQAGHECTLVLAAMHGDEPKTVSLAAAFQERLHRGPCPELQRRFVVVPCVNPDGYARRKRRNSAGVDINRNFPTSNWLPGRPRSRMYGGPEAGSEPETRAVIAAVERFTPDRIITIHSIDRHRFCNNYDGPGQNLAERMSRANGYPVLASIGYPTPGSFGSWAGVERGIATITLELPSHHSTKRCCDDNAAALLLP